MVVRPSFIPSMVVNHKTAREKGPFQESSQTGTTASGSSLISLASLFLFCFSFFPLYCAPHSGASHSSMPVPPVAARAAACQAGNNDAEEGNNAVNDRGEHVADAADNGHYDGADGPEDGFELLGVG